MNADDTKTDKLSIEEQTLLAKLAELDDGKIDTEDIPEAPASHWQHARNGWTAGLPTRPRRKAGKVFPA